MQVPPLPAAPSPSRPWSTARSSLLLRRFVLVPTPVGGGRRPATRVSGSGSSVEGSRAGGLRVSGGGSRHGGGGGSRVPRLSFVFFSEQGESSRGAGTVSCQGVSIGPWTGAAMKILKENAGSLTNFEVLDFLRSRGAKIDPMGCLGAVAASECKVYEYLLKTPACNQTRESIYEFVKRSEGFRLADADKLNVINWRPSSAADAYAMIEECGRRFNRDERGETCNEDKRVQEFLDIVKEVLPPPPPKGEGEGEGEGEGAEAEAEAEGEGEAEAEATQE